VLVKLKYLLKVLEVGSVDWIIDPVVVRFEQEGIVMTNISEGYTLLSHVVVPVTGKLVASEEVGKPTLTTPIIAGEYEAMGEIVFPSRVAKQLKKMFKSDETVRLTVDENNLVIEGTIERFTVGKQILERQIPSIEFAQTEYGLLLAKPKVLGVYNIDLTQLVNLAYEDTVTFRFTQSGIVVATSIADGKYEVKLRTHAVKQAPPSTQIQVFNGEYIETLAKVLDIETAWLVVTEGPLHILVKDPRYPYTATFALAPRMG
jgi:hypothetical protein